jgi:lipoyl(octanoyl) transferase
MEETLIRVCSEFGVPAGRICGLTGVWCDLPLPQNSAEESPCPAPNSSKGVPCAAPGGRKIAAIGIHVARGVTSHGFAFNITTDLRDFGLINPCGITDRPVTSLENEVADPTTLPNLASIAHKAARQFGFVFGQQILAVESLAVLRAQAQSNAAAEPEPANTPAPEFPAEDTPLQVPPEIERLRGVKPRPVST